MFLIKCLFLITIASRLCLALQDWEDNFLKGRCNQFNDAISRLDDWKEKRDDIPALITVNYKGDLKMADRIHNCLSGIVKGTSFEIDEDMMRGILALYRMLARNSQQATNVAFELVISMTKIAPTLSNKFQSPDLELLEGYLMKFKQELPPSVKALFFDDWVVIKHPSINSYLVVYDDKVDMWPSNAHVIDNNNLNWYVEREYRKDKSGIAIGGDAVLDVTFKSAQNDKWLASNDKDEVIATSETNDNYHWWTAQFVNLQNDEIGRFCFKNKQTGKYLNLNGSRDVTVGGQKYNVLSMATNAFLDLDLNLLTGSYSSEWKNMLLDGDHKSLTEWISTHNEWNAIRQHMPDFIKEQYDGNLEMADKILRSVTNVQNSDLAVALEDQLLGHMALAEAIRAKDQITSPNMMMVLCGIFEIQQIILKEKPANQLKLQNKLGDFWRHQPPTVKSLFFEKYTWIKNKSDKDRKLTSTGWEVALYKDNQLQTEFYKWKIEKTVEETETKLRRCSFIFENFGDNKYLASRWRSDRWRGGPWVEDGVSVVMENRLFRDFHYWMATISDYGNTIMLRNRQTKFYLKAGGLAPVDPDLELNSTENKRNITMVKDPGTDEFYEWILI